MTTISKKVESNMKRFRGNAKTIDGAKTKLKQLGYSISQQYTICNEWYMLHTLVGHRLYDFDGKETFLNADSEELVDVIGLDTDQAGPLRYHIVPEYKAERRRTNRLMNIDYYQVEKDGACVFEGNAEKVINFYNRIAKMKEFI